MKNKFCDSSVLKNESSVEAFFLSRLLSDLGFEDSNIKTKESIDELAIPRGRKKVNYKPDYIVLVERKPILIVDAKSPKEKVDDWVDQCSGYCFEINKRKSEEKPVKYYLISNGISTKLYEWDSVNPIAALQFEDFSDSNEKYQKLQNLISIKSLKKTVTKPSKKNSEAAENKELHKFSKVSPEEMNYLFSACHQKIYTKDNLSQAAAFMEFVKLMFLKLLSDKKVHKKYTSEASKNEYYVPKKEVKFSTHWIENAEGTHPNPISGIQFEELKADLESQILEKKKKRMFDKDDSLNLNPETIKTVVQKLQSVDLYSIDADLNGRLFETFLGATMRGKDLGQYFTPRSVVKLIIGIAGLEIDYSDENKIPVIVDPCCGSGGFLIDSLWLMWKLIDKNRKMSEKDKENKKVLIATEKLIGMDVGRDPRIARIARINMYLHGDGGTRIYQIDALDKDPSTVGITDPELRLECNELKTFYKKENGFADLVITNPPFSKVYETKHEPERKILEKYDIAFGDSEKRNTKDSVKTNILFLERYHDLLKPGGTAIAVIDDSVLGGDSYKSIREFIRKKFLVLGVISLPGDAFQRSNARVKTSVIVLRKRTSAEEPNPPIYMDYCEYVGIDDPPRQRVLPIDRENRKKAQEEIERIKASFKNYLNGHGDGKHLVNPATALDRLDVKNCLIETSRLIKKWSKDGFKVDSLRELVNIYDENNMDDDEVVFTETSGDSGRLLRVTYDGQVEFGDEVIFQDVEYKILYRVRPGDIIISNINAVHGAVGIAEDKHLGACVTPEYTICRAKEGYDPSYIWLVLRSPEIRSDMLSLASGMGRTRVKWENARVLKVPNVSDKETKEAIKLIEKSKEAERLSNKLRQDAEALINKKFGTDNSKARSIIQAFKPPR